MKQITRITLGLAFGALLATNGMAKDPDAQRQYHENTSSPNDYYMTLTKEAAAAHKINIQECKAKKHGQKACLAEARKTYDQDMKDAKQKADDMKNAEMKK